VYITTIHREPDEVLLISGVYILGLAPKTVIATYGYHFATEHTERTPQNFKYLFKFLNITFVYNLVIAVLLYKFADYHLHHFNVKYSTNPLMRSMTPNISMNIKGAIFMIQAQLVGFALYYLIWRSLYKKELTQPRIVDALAANIKYAAKRGDQAAN
jgi:hypothetical protein